MPRALLRVLAVVLVAAPSTASAQDRLRFELRADAAIPATKLGDTSLGAGLGFEATLGYRIQPHVSVYAGWDWHRFAVDASFAGASNDFVETGFAFGLQFQHPVGSGAVALQVRAGGTYNHVEIENSAGDLVTGLQARARLGGRRRPRGAPVRSLAGRARREIPLAEA